MENTIKVQVTIDAQIDGMAFEARIFEYSWSDLPKLIDADYFIESYKKALKRFSGYSELTVIVDVSTMHSQTCHYLATIFSIKTIIGRSEIKRSEFINNCYPDFKPSDTKAILIDIKEAVRAANFYQIKK